MAKPPKSSFIAVALYVLVSFILFGLPVACAPSAAHLGFSKDPSFMIWCMVWWPHAIAHGLNPFVTRALWAPVGYNLAWATSIPAVAILLAPVTAVFGPTLSYNIAALLAPALSAWAAFLLYRHLTQNAMAAFAGGLLYGFSPYEVGHVLGGHLSLTPVFVPPLCALLILCAIEGTISGRALTMRFTSLLVLQALVSTETLATMSLFGAAALLAALALLPAMRQRLLVTALRILVAYAAAILILSPFVFYVFAPGGAPKDGFFPSSFFSADVLSYVVPGPLMFVRAPGAAGKLWSGFVGNIFENGSYFGLPLLIVSGSSLWSHRSEPAARMLALLLGIAVIAALGPVLHVNGRPIIALPWMVLEKFPLIRYAVPVRFVNYAFLIFGLILSICVSSPRAGFGTPVYAAVFVALLPNPLFLLHQSRYEIPSFFARGTYRSYLKRDANVLVIPYGISGLSMLWQADSRMYFRMPGGYTGVTPPEFQKWPLLNTLTNSIPVAQQKEQFGEFLQAHKVDAIVVAEPQNAAAAQLPLVLGLKPLNTGGVSLYRLRHDSIKDPAAYDLESFQRMSANLWFDHLLCAAAHFVDGRHPLTALNPVKARDLGLLPSSQWSDNLEVLLAGFKNGSNNGLWVGPGPGGAITIGLPASRAAAGAIVARHAGDVGVVLYPYPSRYCAAADDHEVHYLLTTVRPAALRHWHCDSDAVVWRAPARR